MKKKFNEYFKNIIKGFVLAVMPILFIDLKDLILGEYYSSDFLVYMVKGIAKFGFLGLISSIAYTYSSNFYPKLSKYVIWTIIIGYYTYAVIFFVIGIYFHMIGPLFG